MAARTLARLDGPVQGGELLDVEMLKATSARTREIMENVTPDMYELPTPCKSWAVRDLLNHIVASANWVAHIVENGAAPVDDPYHHVDYAAGDLLGENDAAISATLDAFQQPGAMDKRLKLPFGELKGAHLLDILIDDEFLHGWDLAKATGQAMNEADEQMAAQLLAAAQRRPSIDPFRGPDGDAPYGAEVSVPDSAPALDRLAGFFGRTP
jgi:uncharacterized protein (TIGR03086 family)